jgi:hypothetical protein
VPDSVSRRMAEASPAVIDHLLYDLGAERLRPALLTLDQILEPSPVSTILIEDRLHVMGEVLCAAREVTIRREDERAVSGAARALARGLGRSTLIMSRRVASLDKAVRLSRRREVWFDACRVAGIEQFSEAHDALIAGALIRNRACCERLCSIARSVLPHLPDPRGRSRSDSIAAFEYLSMARRAIGLSGAYVWSEVNGVFQDVASRAIQKALRPKAVRGKRFNPRHAHALQQERARQRGDRRAASASLR